MKILCMTDTHLRGQMGKRNDSYPTAILGKVDWALENTDYDTVVHIGDMFDKPVVPRRIEHAMCDMIARSQRKWNIVVGTHDIGRGTFETAGKSIGALLPLAEATRTSREDVPYSHPDGFNHSVVMRYNSDIALDSMHDARSIFERETDFKIIAAHHQLVREPVPWPHHLVDDFQLPAQIVVSGDYHPGFDPVKVGDTWFCGVGALARTFRSDHDMTRRPRVVIIDTEKYPNDPFEIIELPDSVVESSGMIYDPEVRDVEEDRETLAKSVSDAINEMKSQMGTLWDSILANLEVVELDALIAIDCNDDYCALAMQKLKDLCEEAEGAD